MAGVRAMNGFWEHLVEEWEKTVAAASALLLVVVQAKRIAKAARSVWGVITIPVTLTTKLIESVDRMNVILAKHADRFEVLTLTISRMNHTVQEAQQLSRMSLESSEIAYFQCDPHSGECIWTNHSLQRLFNMSREETLKFGWSAAIHPDDIERVRAVWENTIRQWRPYRVRYRLLINGQSRTMEARADVLRADDGTPLTILGTVTPVEG